MSKKRNLYIDLVKAIVITLVVLSHAIQYGEYGDNPDFFSNQLVKYMYMFHMPLFIAISGYYSYSSISKQSIPQYIKSRIQYLFIPMLVWAVIFTVIMYIFLLPNLNIEFCLTILAKNIVYGYWFIWAIIFYSIFISFLHKVKMDNIIGLTISALLLMLVSIKQFNIPLIETCFPFFAIGYYLAKIDISKYVLFCRKYAILFIVATIVCLYFWNYDTYIYHTSSSFIEWKITLFRLVAGIVTSISFMVILYYIYKKFPNNKVILLLSNVGQETLGIYLSHAVIATLIAKKFIEINASTEYSILYLIPSLLYVVLFYYLSLIIKKNNIAAYLLLGKKI